MVEIKKNRWDYKENEIYIKDGAGKEKGLTFNLSKVIDTSTKKVMLRAKAYDKKTTTEEPLASVDMSLMDLSRGFSVFREYGIILLEYEILDIKGLIEQNFDKITNIETIDKNPYSENRIKEMLKVVAEYILEKDIKPTELNNTIGSLYLIDVNIFKEIYGDSDYKHIDVIELRQKLSDECLKYTKCNPERSSLVIKDKDTKKVSRYVALYADKLDFIIKEVEKEAKL